MNNKAVAVLGFLIPIGIIIAVIFTLIEYVWELNLTELI